MELIEKFSQIAPILSFVTILVAILFGIIQVRNFNRQRKDLAAVEVMRSVQTRDFTDSLINLSKVKQGTGRKELNRMFPGIETEILAIATKFETLGFLVFRKVVPIAFVEELVGGVCIRYWDKLEVYVRDFRKQEGQPIFLEWFEWLAHQFKKRNRHHARSAIERFT